MECRHRYSFSFPRNGHWACKWWQATYWDWVAGWNTLHLPLIGMPIHRIQSVMYLTPWKHTFWSSLTHSSKQTSILMFRVFLGCYRKFDVDIGCERETRTQRDRRNLPLLLRRSGGKRMSEIGSLLCWESRFSPKLIISLSIKSKTYKFINLIPNISKNS